MRKICFITGTRADYGIMAPLIREVADAPCAQLQIIATNMHLSEEYGVTVNEILDDGFNVDYRIPCLQPGDTPVDTVRAMAEVQKGLADVFPVLQPDLVVILGDRFEMLAAASAATVFNIPVAHLHGGETTEGAYDDSFRHAITKLSFLHFAATREYADRIIRMGEEQERVFHSGALGVENVLSEKLLSLKELEGAVNFMLGQKYIVAVFHPVTLSPDSGMAELEEMLSALDDYIATGWKVLFTLPNSDTGGKKISKKIMEWGREYPDSVIAVKSLGRRKFFSALSHASFMIGNSSSGLLEAPVFRIPTVNIGIRQKGRSAGPSVINCSSDTTSIKAAIEKALSHDFKDHIASLEIERLNPYYKKDTRKFICDTLLNFPLSGG